MDEHRNGRQLKPLLMWLDFSFTPQGREPRVASARHFRMSSTTRLDRALEDIASLKPSALCLEFDHVDVARKQVLEDVIENHPRLPTLMLTAEHSEALAVWAFRAGVWNYLVKPVPDDELSGSLARLAQVALRAPTLRTPRPPGVRTPRDLVAAPAEAHVARLEPALQYVRRHYADKICETEAARRCGMKRFTFSHSFHAVFGLTFREYVMKTRIGEARRMLTEGGHPVTEVAFATGFTDGSYFARTFRRYTGVLPSEYCATSPASFPAP